MSIEEPKLLKPERVVELYKVFTVTGQIFEGSHMLELFEHIASLTNRIKEMDEQTRKFLEVTVSN